MMRRDPLHAKARGDRRAQYLRAATPGFTILEVLIAAAIMGILMAAIYSVLMSGRSTYSSGEVKADIQQNARLALETITTDFRLIGYGVPTDPTLPSPVLEKITAASATAITFRADLANTSTTLGADIVAGATTLPTSDTKGITAGDRIYLVNGGTFYPKTTFPGVQVTAVTVNTNITIASGDGTNAYPQGTQIGRPLEIRYCFGAGCPTVGPDGPPPSFNANTIYKSDGTQILPQGWQPLASNVTSFALSYFDSNDAALPGGAWDAGKRANIRRIVVTMEVRQSTSVGPSGTQKFTLTSDVRPRNLF